MKVSPVHSTAAGALPRAARADIDTERQSGHTKLTQLAKGRLLRIEDGAGHAVAVLGGLVWITQHADPRDLIIGAGGSVALERAGSAVVQALRDSSVLLVERGHAPRGTARRLPRSAPAASSGTRWLMTCVERLVPLFRWARSAAR